MGFLETLRDQDIIDQNTKQKNDSENQASKSSAMIEKEPVNETENLKQETVSHT